MTKEEREVSEVFLQMLAAHNKLPIEEREGRYLQTTKIADWLSKKVKREVTAKETVKLFETAGYTFEFVKGGFHHWVKQRGNEHI